VAHSCESSAFVCLFEGQLNGTSQLNGITLTVVQVYSIGLLPSLKQHMYHRYGYTRLNGAIKETVFVKRQSWEINLKKA